MMAKQHVMMCLRYLTKKYSYSTELNGCIVDKHHISSFLGKMEPFFKDDTLVSVFFYDSTSIEKVKKSEFDEYDFSNLRVKTINIHLIKHLYKTSTSDEIESSVWLKMDSQFNDNKVSVSSSSFDEYSKLRTIVDEWIRSITSQRRQKVIRILKKDFIISPLSTILMVIFTIFGMGYHNLFSDMELINIILPCIVFIFFYSSIVGFLVNRIKSNFPPTEIDIGENIYESRRKWIGWFITTILIPVLFFIISAVIKHV